MLFIIIYFQLSIINFLEPFYLRQIGVCQDLDRRDGEHIQVLVEGSTLIAGVTALAFPAVGDVHTTEAVVTDQVRTADVLEVELTRTLVEDVVKAVAAASGGVGALTDSVDVLLGRRTSREAYRR